MDPARKTGLRVAATHGADRSKNRPKPGVVVWSGRPRGDGQLSDGMAGGGEVRAAKIAVRPSGENSGAVVRAESHRDDGADGGRADDHATAATDGEPGCSATATRPIRHVRSPADRSHGRAGWQDHMAAVLRAVGTVIAATSSASGSLTEDEGYDQAATVLGRRRDPRSIAPIPPKPTSIIAQMVGSGTPEIDVIVTLPALKGELLTLS